MTDIAKFVGAAFLAALVVLAAFSCKQVASDETPSSDTSANQDQQTAEVRGPTQISEALFSDDTIGLVRINLGKWPALLPFAERMSKAEGPPRPEEALFRLFAQEGALEGMQTIGFPPEVSLGEAKKTLDPSRDAFARIDIVRDDTMSAMHERGLYIPFIRWGELPVIRMTIMLPSKDVEASEAAFRAVNAHDKVLIGTVGDYVVLSQNPYTWRAAETLPPGGTAPSTPAASEFMNAPALAAVYIDNRNAIAARWAHEQIRFLEHLQTHDLPRFPQEMLQAHVSTAMGAMVIPTSAYETIDHAFVLNESGQGLAIDSVTTLSPAGEEMAKSFPGVESARLPTFEYDDGSEERVWMSLELAGSPAELTEWTKLNSTLRTLQTIPARVEFRIDDFYEEPAMWASPGRFITWLMEREPELASAEKMAIHGTSWTALDGSVEAIFAVFVAGDFDHDALVARSTARGMEASSVEGGVVLLSKFGRRVTEVTVAPTASWRVVRAGHASFDADMETIGRDRYQARRNAFVGRVRGRLVHQDGVLRGRIALNGADAKPAEARWDAYEPADDRSTGDACAESAATALSAYVSALEYVAWDHTRRPVDEVQTLKTEASSELARCAQEDPDGARGFQMTIGRLEWLSGLYHVAITKDETAARNAFRAACKAGFGVSCGDDVVAYWSGKTCPEPYFQEVVVAKAGIVKGSFVSRVLMTEKCIAAAEKDDDMMTSEQLDRVVGRDLNRSMAAGDFLRSTMVDSD